MHHEMVLEQTHPSGAEEWVCPICGRRFVMTWKPYRRVVLEAGDESATHSGSKGGVKVGAVTVIPDGPETDPSASSGQSLSAFRDWIDGVDFGDET